MLFNYFKKTEQFISSSRKHIIYFLCLNFIFLAVPTLVNKFICLKGNSTIFCLVWYLLCLIICQIFFFINKYHFLKFSVQKLTLNYSTLAITQYLLKIVQVFLIQTAIAIVFILLGSILYVILLFLFQKLSVYITTIFSIVVIGFLLFWFVRLFFVPFLLIFQRFNNTVSSIVEDSKYIVKKYLLLLVGMYLLLFLIVSPRLIYLVQNGIGYHNDWIVSLISSFIYGFIYVACVFILLEEVLNSSDITADLQKIS